MTTTQDATPLLRERRFTIGAVLLVLNAGMYVVCEAIAASAWRDPTYSYSLNYISDLGVPDVGETQGRMIDSPLHAVMNTAFVLHGVIFVIAAALLWHAVLRTGLRRAYLVLAGVHAVGMSLVGLFPGSQAALDDGTIVLHGLGALLAIVAGNTAAIVVGTDLLRRRVRGLGRTLITLGVLGLAGFLYLLATSGSGVDGIPERVAVYTVTAAETVAGIAVLVAGRASRRARASISAVAGSAGRSSSSGS
ncbi:putative membrane protein [Nocardioides albertanoniae]|uniref:Putative membrane protein n=1 Tax=Nocardioides albertanoniae TaxID=1175486 RepID=A0A543AA09_9ACTN|nr:DUF998 domain-containing protein [Nocardioides albertanoniae]TQL69438.1 putative membrane protein [Nocardioides albertanoniae]